MGGMVSESLDRAGFPNYNSKFVTKPECCSRRLRRRRPESGGTCAQVPFPRETAEHAVSEYSENLRKGRERVPFSSGRGPGEPGTRIFMAKNRLSPQRLKELQDELNYLITVREKEVAELIKEARSFGDLSENSEYDEAKNEQGKLYARKAELQDILSDYEIVEEEITAGGIHMGSVVTVKDLEFDEEETYKIVGSHEADPVNGFISEESPIGRALLGTVKKKVVQDDGTEAEEEVPVSVNDIVTAEAPAGLIQYQVISIE